MSGEDAQGDAGSDVSEESSAPRLDMTEALHMAGHEVDDLGLEGVPDTAPAIEDDEYPPEQMAGEFEHHVESDIATRGADGL
jgi:hypothetical protein